MEWSIKARKRFKPEEVIHTLSGAEIKLAAGSTTRFERCAQCIAAWRWAWVLASVFAPVLNALPRLAGVTPPSQRWFSAGTPWNRVRLTLGFGTGAANRAMKSTVSQAACVALSP